MSRESKNILKIGIIAYVIISVLSMIKVFEIEALEDILKISNVSIPITTIILFAYIKNRGEDKIPLSSDFIIE